MNAHRGHASVKLVDGSELNLRVTWDVMGHLQSDFELAEFTDVPNVLLEIFNGKRNASCVSTFVYRMANAAGADFASRADVDAIDFASMLDVLPAIMEAFKNSGFIKLEEKGAKTDDTADAGNAKGPNRHARRKAAATARA